MESLSIQDRGLRPKPLQENNLDFLRFGLAVLVVFSHSYPLLHGKSDNEPLLWLTNRFSVGRLSFGWIAVNCFFVLSGFLITHSWLNSRGAGDYLKKRVLRIFPGFVVASLLCIFVAAPLGVPDAVAYFKTLDVPELLGMTALLRGYEGPGVFTSLPFPNAVNGSLWTVQYEFWCYLVVALLGAWGALRSRMGLLGLLAGAMLLYGVQLWHDWQGDIGYAEKFLAGPQEWPRLITYYLAGVAFYCWHRQIPRSWWLAVACVIGLLISARFGMAMFLTLPILGTYLFFYLAFSRMPWLQDFGRYGDFSYGIYLYSFPIQQLLIQQFAGISNPITLFLLAMPPTLVVAAFSWFCVEKPFLKRKRRSPAPSSTQLPQRLESVADFVPKSKTVEEVPVAVE